MKKISTKDQNKFVRILSSEILAIGGKNIPENPDPTRFEINTIAGRLFIHVDDDSSYCYTMFTRFEDVERAKEKFTCNPFSGKYNFHIGAIEAGSPAQAAELCLIEIERTIEN